MVLVIMLVFGLISGLLYVLVVPFIVVGAIAGSDLLLFAGILMLLPAMAISVITSLLMPAVGRIRGDRDLVKAINPVMLASRREPSGILGAVVATIIVRSCCPSAVLVVTILDDVRRMPSASYIYPGSGRANMAVPVTGAVAPQQPL
jgi:hypothetical protein